MTLEMNKQYKLTLECVDGKQILFSTGEFAIVAIRKLSRKYAQLFGVKRAIFERALSKCEEWDKQNGRWMLVWDKGICPIEEGDKK